MPIFFGASSLKCMNASAIDESSGSVSVAVLLHYDTYYHTINLTEMHSNFERALSYLKDERFPMDRVLVVTWRNTLSDESDFTWLMKTLNTYGVPVDEGHFGLYIAPEEAHDPTVLNWALETFRDGFGRFPFFVAGFSASSNTYLQLVNHGARLSFFNLWEEGEDYTYRGHSTSDEIFAANWEGSPFQPYKPSRRTGNAPGLTEEDELDIWEAHWITRNPSYAFTVINSRSWGSIHPLDLLSGNWSGSWLCSPSEAFGKFRKILDLVDFNAKFNPVMVVSYPVEVSLFGKSNVFEVWCDSIREFMRRKYEFVDAVELRGVLDSLSVEPPHTPVYVWFDNLTSSDMVVAGEHTPFALLSSPYGRFICARQDPLNDSGTPFISVTSYTTAKAHNETFQSIRELTGVGELKLNTLVNGVPIDMRWLNDVSTVMIVPGGAMAIKWVYTKSEVPYVEHSMVIYLTPKGVLVEKEVRFSQDINAQVSMVHYLNVQGNSPTPFIDGSVWAETDVGDVFYFSSINSEVIEKRCSVNDTLIFTAWDGYALGVTKMLGSPDMVKTVDELDGSPFQTLEFVYNMSKYEIGDKLQLSYVLTPARDVSDARKLANAVGTLVEGIKSGKTPTYTVGSGWSSTKTSFDGLGIGLLILIAALITLTSILLLKGQGSDYAGVKRPKRWD